PSDARAATFSPAPLPTHAGCFATGRRAITSLVGLMAGPGGPRGLNGAVSCAPTFALQRPVTTRQGLRLYHIFSAPRPWIFSQWYLAADSRPVDLARTAALLAALGGTGLVLLAAGSRARCPAWRASTNYSSFDV